MISLRLCENLFATFSRVCTSSFKNQGKVSNDLRDLDEIFPWTCRESQQK